MDSNNNPWQDTPEVANRIVTAISRISTVIRASAWQFAIAQGLTPTQSEMLQLLYSRKKGMRLSWIAEQLSITPATASDSVAALVTKGYVEKTRAVDDGRAIALRLSDKGLVLAQRVGESAQFAEEATRALPAHMQETLFLGLLKLIGELQHNDRFPELRTCVTCKHFEANRQSDDPAPHYCHLVKAPLTIAMVRLDCPEHDPTTPANQRMNWQSIT